MPTIEMNTERGHVCPICKRTVSTGYYFTERDVPEGATSPAKHVARRFHLPCADLFDLTS